MGRAQFLSFNGGMRIAFSKTLLLILVTSCVPENFSSENSQGGHGGGDVGNSAGMKKGLFGGRKLDGLGKGLGKVLDMRDLHLTGAKGSWTPKITELARREIISHPNLIQGIPGKGNPLSGICNNYFDLNPDQRINVMLKVAPSLAYGEGHFGKNGNGGERSSYNLALGPFQISRDAKNFGCWVNGYAPFDYAASLDCVYKIMDSQYSVRGLPIANNKSHWSVMRPGYFLSSRFLTTFKRIAPECQNSYQVKHNKNFPGAEIAGQGSENGNAI